MSRSAYGEPMKNKKPSFFKRFMAVLLVTLLLLGVAAYGGLYILLKGPSPYAAGMLADAAEELPFGTAVLHLFLDDEEIARCKQAADANGGDEEALYSLYPKASEE